MSMKDQEALARLDEKEDTIEKMGQRIARLSKECDELREALTGLVNAIDPTNNGELADLGNIEPYFVEPLEFARKTLNADKETGG